MKTGLHIILLITVLVSIFHKTLIIGSFYLRKAYIIEYLCENRQKPELHCDGKCYLKKQINASETAKNNIPSFPVLDENVTFYYELVDKFVFLTPIINHRSVFLRYQIPQTESPLSDIFRPPSLA